MNLFDELCKDAKADLDSGKYLQDPNGDINVDRDVMASVDAMEKKMRETLDNAVEKINNAVDAATAKSVPETVETNDNVEESEGEN